MSCVPEDKVKKGDPLFWCCSSGAKDLKKVDATGSLSKMLAVESVVLVVSSHGFE